MTPVRLEAQVPRPRVKHSTTEPRHEISTMRYVWPAKPQISSLIRAFASRLNILRLLSYWPTGFMHKRRLHRIVWVYTCGMCGCSEGSDQPAHMGSLIWAFASRLNILWVLSYWQTAFGVSMHKRRLHRLVCVYTCQNATLLEITCRGSIFFLLVFKIAYLAEDAVTSQRMTYNLHANATDDHGICTTLVRARGAPIEL